MEWQMVTVIVVLVGLIGGITAPIIKLIGTITKLTSSVDSLKEDVKDLKNNIKEINEKNAESHARIWKHNEEQDTKIHEYDKRITVLERKP